MNKLLLQKYKISQKTFAIIPSNHLEYKSLILESGREILCNQTPQQIIEESCIFFGASYIGRRTATASILRTNKKNPIPVSPFHHIYMLPTSSFKNKHCVWIAYYKIDSYVEQNSQTLVTFDDESTLPLDTSVASFHKQFSRTSIVIAQLFKRVLPFKWKSDNNSQNYSSI